MLFNKALRHIKNNFGQSLISILISFALLTILLLGLSTINSLVVKSFKNVSLDFDSQLETMRLQFAFADLGKACQKTYGGKTFQYNGSTISQLVFTPDVTSLKYADGTNIISVGDQVGNNMNITSINIIEVSKLNDRVFKGKLSLTYQKSNNISIGAQTLNKKFPLFIQTAISGSTVTIQDCATTSTTLPNDIGEICNSIANSSGSATWDSTTGKCTLPP